MVRTSKRIRARDLIIDVDYLEINDMFVSSLTSLLLVNSREIVVDSFF